MEQSSYGSAGVRRKGEKVGMGGRKVLWERMEVR